MTDERERLTVDGGSLDTESREIDDVDPEVIAALDDEQDSGDPAATDESLAHDGPTPERFEEFVRDVDAGRVTPADGTEDDVPIDASMDELFAER